MYRPPIHRLLPLLLLTVLAQFGCGLFRSHHANPSPAGFGWVGPPAPQMLMENPLAVPPMNEDYLWSQLVDTLDDYFKIEREDRIRVSGGVVSEGRIETFPETASGYLEPWRRDSTPGHEKLLSTLQSMRRRALVRVTPGPQGYLVHVTVLKELEDVSRPEFATVGGSSLRHDGSVVRTSPARGAQAITLGWIPVGRDPGLEQQLLYELQARLTGPPPSAPPRSHPFHRNGP